MKIDPYNQIVRTHRITGDVESASERNQPSTTTPKYRTHPGMWSALCLLCLGLFSAVPPKAMGASWVATSPMNRARSFFGMAELLNGDVLVAGGYDGLAFFVGGHPMFADSEIYDLHSGTWRVIAPMNVARGGALAVRLPDGRVLVVGGFDDDFNSLDSAEIFDPRSGTWALTGSTKDAHGEDNFTAALLPEGRVLVAGGVRPGFIVLDSAEVWDPRTGQWTPTGSLNIPRVEASTTVLRDGRVLVAGGHADEAEPAVASAEIYDPRTGQWTLTGSMNQARADQVALLLADGRVLVAGGDLSDDVPRLVSAEIYDPRTGTWTLTGSMMTGRSESESASVLLPDGRVLVPGGHTAFETPISSAELYDPRTGTWTAAGSMSDARAGHSAVLLRGNRGVLVVGGLDVPPLATASVDIFQTR